MLSEDLPLIETLQAGRIPDAWQPLETTTDREVTILAPLEIVSARGRAAKDLRFRLCLGGLQAGPASAAGAITPCRSCMATGWWRASIPSWNAPA